MKGDYSVRNLAAWLLVATAYAVAFFQRMAPQSINNELINAFNLTPTGVAVIASGYYWGYTIMQLPAGPLVDRFGLRRMILISTLISALGSFLFSVSINPSMAFFSRALLACGDAFVFTSLLKLVSVGFKGNNFGLMSGLSQASGYIGGALASAPLAFLASKYGLFAVFSSVSLIVLALFLGCCVFVKNNEDHKVLINVGENIKLITTKIIKHRAFWAILAVNAVQIAIITIIAGVWGLTMISSYFSVSPSIAGWGIIMFMAGSLAGTVVIGKLVDLVNDNSVLLSWILLIETISLVILFPVVAQCLGFVIIIIDLFVLGFLTGGSIPSILHAVKQIFTVSLVSTGASLCMTVAGIFTAAILPLIGWMISMYQIAEKSSFDKDFLQIQSFNIIIVVSIIISILSFFISFLLRKTHINKYI